MIVPIDALPFSDGAFEAATSLDVLEHVPRGRSRALRARAAARDAPARGALLPAGLARAPRGRRGDPGVVPLGRGRRAPMAHRPPVQGPADARGAAGGLRRARRAGAVPASTATSARSTSSSAASSSPATASGPRTSRDYARFRLSYRPRTELTRRAERRSATASSSSATRPSRRGLVEHAQRLRRRRGPGVAGRALAPGLAPALEIGVVRTAGAAARRRSRRGRAGRAARRRRRRPRAGRADRSTRRARRAPSPRAPAARSPRRASAVTRTSAWA